MVEERQIPKEIHRFINIAEEKHTLEQDELFCCVIISSGLKERWGFPVAQMVKSPPAMQETWVPSLGWEDLREKGMATLSSILA